MLRTIAPQKVKFDFWFLSPVRVQGIVWATRLLHIQCPNLEALQFLLFFFFFFFFSFQTCGFIFLHSVYISIFSFIYFFYLFICLFIYLFIYLLSLSLVNYKTVHSIHNVTEMPLKRQNEKKVRHTIRHCRRCS